MNPYLTMEFDASGWARCEEAAQLRNQNHANGKAPSVVDKENQYCNSVLGIAAEWAAHLWFSVDPEPVFADLGLWGTDGGVDVLLADGLAISVKSTRYANGWLIISQKQIQEYTILVTGRVGSLLTCRGFTTRENWHENNELHDFGHGLTPALQQDFLHPITTPWLARRCAFTGYGPTPLAASAPHCDLFDDPYFEW